MVPFVYLHWETFNGWLKTIGTIVMEIYKYLQWINFLREWNPGIETPGHFIVWWLRLHQARIGAQIPHFMVSVFLRVSLPDRQTDAKGMKLL